MSSPSRALLDLGALHGTGELRVGQTFASGKSATYFM
ncbi:hypothetical protein PF003_g26969 [Phytophthora fragariae]|nr:hypothetical protein PF003_g26969 [Phytophthora fragariae]